MPLRPWDPLSKPTSSLYGASNTERNSLVLITISEDQSSTKTRLSLNPRIPKMKELLMLLTNSPSTLLKNSTPYSRDTRRPPPLVSSKPPMLKLLTALIGDKRTPLPLLRIKVNAVHVGLSPLLVVWKVSMLSRPVNWPVSLNNKSLIALLLTKVATVVIYPLLLITLMLTVLKLKLTILTLLLMENANSPRQRLFSLPPVTFKSPLKTLVL